LTTVTSITRQFIDSVSFVRCPLGGTTPAEKGTVVAPALSSARGAFFLAARPSNAAVR